MSTLSITSITAGALSVWTAILTINVIRNRRRAMVPIGDGQRELDVAKGKEDFKPEKALNYYHLRNAIRAHANLGEYFPPFIIVLGLNELKQNLSPTILSIIAAAFILGRIVHFIGITNQLDKGDDHAVVRRGGAGGSGRGLGTMAAIFSIFGLGATLVWKGLFA